MQRISRTTKLGQKAVSEQLDDPAALARHFARRQRDKIGTNILADHFIVGGHARVADDVDKHHDRKMVRGRKNVVTADIES
jgi:hypothetical protein